MEITMIDKYYEKVLEALKKIKETQYEKILKAAEIVSDSIKADGLVHLFGTGHSHLIALEAYSRAGGLAPVNAILEDNLMLHQGARKSGAMERLEGYSAAILALNDVTKNDCMIIISNSGRNAVPIEMALEARKRGLPTIAITSMAHAKSVLSRHSSGKRLHEIVPISINNYAPSGDACLEVPGLEAPTAAISTITGAFIINSIIAAAVEMLVAQNIAPPIFISGNSVEGDLHNYNLYVKYKNRVKF